MYSFIKGLLVEKSDRHLVVEAGGVGYEALVTPRTAAALRVGSKVQLFVHLVVSEEAHTLFGFATPEEKAVFLQVSKVSGVGPKTALGVLTMEPNELRQAIERSDVDTLCRLPGIGKKTAQRLILELSGRLTGPEEALPEQIHLAVEALQQLGFDAQIARAAVQRVENAEGKTLEELLKAALSALGSRKR